MIPANPDLIVRLRTYHPTLLMALEAADAIEARKAELKTAWMQRDSLQETIREYQALMQERDAEIKQLRDEIRYLRGERTWDEGEHEGCGRDTERAVKSFDLRAAAERMAKALDAVTTDPRAMWNYNAWKEARDSAAAFRDMSE